MLYNLPEQEQSVALIISGHFYTVRIISVKTVLSCFVLQQENRPVQMMYQFGSFKVAVVASEKIKILELPYASGQLSMLVLLPDEVSGLEQVWPWQLSAIKP